MADILKPEDLTAAAKFKFLEMINQDPAFKADFEAKFPSVEERDKARDSAQEIFDKTIKDDTLSKAASAGVGVTKPQAEELAAAILTGVKDKKEGKEVEVQIPGGFEGTPTAYLFDIINKNADTEVDVQTQKEIDASTKFGVDAATITGELKGALRANTATRSKAASDAEAKSALTDKLEMITSLKKDHEAADKLKVPTGVDTKVSGVITTMEAAMKAREKAVDAAKDLEEKVKAQETADKGTDDAAKTAAKAATEAARTHETNEKNSAKASETAAISTHTTTRTAITDVVEKDGFDRALQVAIDKKRKAEPDFDALWKKVGKTAELGDLGKALSTDYVTRFIKIPTETSKEIGSALGTSASGGKFSGSNIGLGIAAGAGVAAAVGSLFAGRETDPQTQQKKGMSFGRKVLVTIGAIVTLGAGLALARGTGNKWQDKVRTGIPGAGWVMGR